MGAPKVKLNVPKTGQAAKGTSNAQRLRDVIALRNQFEKVKGVEQPVPTLDIFRSLILGGTDESRGFARQIWETLDDKQQQIIKTRMIEEMPDARYPSGVNEEGSQVFSTDAQKILDAVEGSGLDEASKAVGKQISDSTSAPVEPGERGPNVFVAYEDGGGRTEQSYIPGDINKVTSLDRDGAMGAEAPGDPESKKGLSRPGPLKGFDPKAAGVHDPSKSSKIETRPHFRVDYETNTGDDGVITREVKDFSLARADAPAIRAGINYEEALKKRDELRAELLIAQTGSMQNAAALFRRAEEGDPEAKATISSINVMLNKDAPLPRKPTPIPDFQALNTESTPLSQFDRYAWDLGMGSPVSPTFTPKRGKFDTAMALWQALQTKTGSNALIPNKTFSSPRQMAEQIVRNMSQEVFDTGSIGSASSRFSKGSLQTTVDNVPHLREQFTDRLAQSLEERFGSQWGEGASTTAPVDKASMSPAPASSEPDSPVSTSRDTWAGIPHQIIRNEEGGQSVFNNSAEPSIYKPGSFEDTLKKYQDEQDALLGKTRNDKAFKEYLDSDEYLSTPVKPKQFDPSATVDSPDPTADSFDLEDHGDNAVAALKDWRAQKEKAGWTIEDKGDGTYIARDSKGSMKRPEWTPGETPRTWNELDAEEQHKRTYQNYEGGELAEPSSSSNEDELAEYNLRNRMTPAAKLAERDRMIDRLSENFPQIKGAGKTSDIVKQIDALQDQIDNYPAEINKLHDELESEGLTPARAKEIREQLKPMYAAHEQSVAGLEAQVKELNGQLVQAKRGDQLTGIQSKRKPPLSGKVKAAKEGGQAGNPADTAPATPPPEVKVEDDTAVIEGRPPADPPPADSSANTGNVDKDKFLEAFEIGDDSDPPPANTETAKAAATNPAPSPAPEAMGMDDYIDPLDSASSVEMDDALPPPGTAVDMDNPLTADTGNAPGQTEWNVDPPEAKAAAKADEAEAPRDAESARPEAEAETIPEGTGSEQTPTVRNNDKNAKPPVASKFPIKRSLAAAAAGGAGLLALNSIGHRINQGSASGQAGLGGGMPGGMPAGMDGSMGPGGFADAAANDNPYGYSTADPAERIRMIQQMRSRVPTGIPQTAQQWR